MLTLDPAVARATPGGWAAHCWRGRWAYPRHLQLIDRVLVATATSGGRALIETPPRHGKSSICARALAAWFLGLFPEKRVAIACGAFSLGRRWGRMARADFAANAPGVWGLTIEPDHSAAEDWKVAGHDGGMRSYGVGSQFSGEGADLLILDDLILDAEQAMSEVQRESVWDWIEAVAWSRLEPGAAVVSICTRWHEDDPHGRFLARMPEEDWTVLRLPAIAEDGDPLGRAPGAALWPERYDAEALALIRAGKSGYFWSAQYQQRPTPQEGGVWKRDWFTGTRYDVDRDGRLVLGDYSVPLGSLRPFLIVDPAFTTKRLSAYTVIMAAAMTPEPTPRLVVLEVDRARREGPDLWPAVDGMLERWRMGGAGVVWFEREGQQIGIVQEARRRGYAVKTLGRSEADDMRISGDKVAVGNDGSPLAAAGRAWLPRAARWLADFEGEVFSFPNAPYADQADVLAWACQIVLRTGVRSGIMDTPYPETSAAAGSRLFGDMMPRRPR